MIFWTLILCHLIADYPLQTDAMVNAKRKISGLLMHVAIHFLTTIVIFCGVLNYEIRTGFSLALAISFCHLAIDHWKNSLSSLRPTWVIFTYIQDQILHILSIFFVATFWQSATQLEQPMGGMFIFIYASGFIISTHVWFVTEKVLSYNNPANQQWLTQTMWPRMMSRAVFYSSMLIGLNLWTVLAIIGGIFVVWHDLKEKNRMQTIILDMLGVLMFAALAISITDMLV